MNDVIMIGEVCSRIVGPNSKGIVKITLKINSNDERQNEFVPILFKNMNSGNFLPLVGKTIAINGHVECGGINKIIVDVLKVMK